MSAKRKVYITDFFPYKRAKYDKKAFLERKMGTFTEFLLKTLLSNLEHASYHALRHTLPLVCKTWDVIIAENEKAKAYVVNLIDRRVKADRGFTITYPKHSNWIAFQKDEIECDLPFYECSCGCIGICQGEMNICHRCHHLNCEAHTWRCDICQTPFCESALNRNCIKHCEHCDALACKLCLSMKFDGEDLYCENCE